MLQLNAGAQRREDDQAPRWAPAVTLGAVSAAAMASPSLFPRAAAMQRLGVAGAAVIGAGVGFGVDSVARGMDRVIPGGLLESQLAVGGVGAVAAAGIAVATRGRVTGGRAALQTGGMLVAGGGAASAASSAVARVDEQLPGHDGLAQGVVAAAVGGVVLASSLRNAAITRQMSYVLPDLPELAADGSTFGKLAVDRGRDARGLLTSGVEGSPVSWAKMPGQGKRFLTEMPHADEIAHVMGAPAKEPIRTFVGIKHVDADGDEYAAVLKRVQLAMDDLEHQGAFGRWRTSADGTVDMLEPPRRSILVTAPTANGFVNPVAASSHEFMVLGDSATVAIQGGIGPTPAPLHHVARATATQRELLERVAARVRELPEDVRPSVNYYGESFGAWAGQESVQGTGARTTSWLARRFGNWNGPVAWTDQRIESAAQLTRRLDELGIDRAMFVGNPHAAQLRSTTAGVAELTTGNHPPIRTIRNLHQAKGLSAADTANTRITFLQHDADPVGLFTPKLLWERPDWLGPAATRGDNIPQRQRWMPVITGIQTGIDNHGSMFYRPGVFDAKGHDYRAEVSYVMRRAFGAGDVSDVQVSRIREWNRQLENLHMERQQQARAAKAAAAKAAAGATG